MEQTETYELWANLVKLVEILHNELKNTHCDIRPQNIMVFEEHAVLIDIACNEIIFLLFDSIFIYELPFRRNGLLFLK